MGGAASEIVEKNKRKKAKNGEERSKRARGAVHEKPRSGSLAAQGVAGFHFARKIRELPRDFAKNRGGAAFGFGPEVFGEITAEAGELFVDFAAEPFEVVHRSPSQTANGAIPVL
jgi:hypothetical protein